MKNWKGAFVGVVLAVGAAAALGFLWWNAPVDDTAEKEVAAEELRQASEIRDYLEQADDSMRAKGYRDALGLLENILGIDPNHPRALLMAAKAAEAIKEIPQAFAYLKRVPEKSSLHAEGKYRTALLHYRQNDYVEAEAVVREAMAAEKSHVMANDLLVELLDVQGRRWESVPFALEVVRQREATLELLVLLADQTLVVRRKDRAERASQRDPKNMGAVFGLGRAALADGDLDGGMDLVRRAVAGQADFTEAQLVLAEQLLNTQPAAFIEWHGTLPKTAESYPDLWLLRGLWFRREKNFEGAARCLWESVRRNPNSLAANLQLGQVLQQLGKPDQAKPFLDRAVGLARLKKVLKPVTSAGDDASADMLLDVAVALESLGRGVEAENWEQKANERLKKRSAFGAMRPAPRNEAALLSLWVRPDSNPTFRVDLSKMPLPEINASAATEVTGSESSYVAKFENLAEATGLRFAYVPGPDPETEGKRVVELTGGGAAAIDYDLDNRPDVFLTQGGLLPAAEDADLPSDKLFRNRFAGEVPESFVDVTELAGIASTDFGQGMAVGDIDADGFPDLFLTNLGGNRLFLNNGDGTFAESALPQSKEGWSTSAAIADLSGDGLADIYVVNYLAGDDLQTVICQPNKDVPPRICTPDRFAAEQDQLLVNNGTGSFRDVTAQSGIQVSQGKGLGLVVANFFDGDRLQVFVANDGVPNFFFEPKDGVAGARFAERATEVGADLSDDGAAQACMGVACGDVNFDGRPDLFITNFEKESNALYSNQGYAFEDIARRSGIRESSFRWLGFGTQFVDGDLDGNPDLLLTNGHVDDFSHDGKPYRMPAQFLKHNGAVRPKFEEIAAEKVGPFFNEQQLGRGLCRLDWNRDGRADAVISHLDTPAALLTNSSENTGHFLSVKLIGTTCERDAIGAKVRIVDGDWVRVQQRVAGHGYECSNERTLVFGLGDRTVVPELEVKWPDGSTQLFQSESADREVVIVQGGAMLVNVD